MNRQLPDYINQSRQAGKTNDQIRQELLNAGWQEDLINWRLEAPSKDSTPSNEILEKELNEHKSLDQKHIALDQEHADLDQKHLAIDAEHITADKKHKKFDRVITIASIVTISLAGAALLSFTGYKTRVDNVEQKLTQQEGKAAGQEQKLTQQQEEVDALKKIVVDIPSVIKEWEPRMAVIFCEWDYIPRVRAYAVGQGSGLLLRVTLSSGAVVYDLYTNKHVIESQGFSPSRCIFGLAGGPKLYTVENESINSISTNFLWGAKGDWGVIKLSEDDNIVYRASGKMNVCRHPMALGGRVLLLGYPGVGSKESITSTEGIISGYDGDYYVTDAKFEHGSSGGAAIALKENCYLGIPTGWVEGDSTQAFGRILRSDVFLPSTYLR